MRSMRRGIKEMDIIFVRYVDACLTSMNTGELDIYDALLNENDQDLYQWVTGQVDAPERFKAVIADIVKLIGSA